MRKKNISKNNQGFTLIELLIVIIIIGILATAAFVYLNPTEWTARANDTKRLADLKNLNDSIQREVAQGSIVLVATSGISSTLDANANLSGVASASPFLSQGFIKFNATIGTYKFANFPTLPVDPKNNTSITYKYWSDTAKTIEATGTVTAKYKFCTSATGYELNAVLENDKNKMADDGGNSPQVFEIGTDLTACTGTDF